MNRLPCFVLAAAACTPAALPASAETSTPPIYPSISQVAPLTLGVGDALTIRGKGFRAGYGRTTVVFKRDGGRAIFVKATKATSSQLTVVIPARLVDSLITKSGKPTSTRFRVRVLAARFGRRYTSTATSPLIGPTALKSAKPAPAPAPAPANGPTAPDAPTIGPAAVLIPPTVGPVAQDAQPGCDGDPSKHPINADEDKDMLSDALEATLKTDPCNSDTDDDGVDDGYEYSSAKDLNGASTPGPSKRPWPNPLDGTDASYDFDGDGLAMNQEFALWKHVSNPITSTGRLGAYSDGLQDTGGRVAVTDGTNGTKDTRLLDRDGDGNLTDDERDADGDGLSNQVEFNTSGTQAYWRAVFTAEKPYIARLFNDLDPTSADTDGDGVVDGQDDQDNDGYDNITEMQKTRRQSGLRIAPFNPCLPDPHAITCSRYAPIDASTRWAPFDDSEIVYDPSTPVAGGSVIPFTYPDTSTTDPALAWDGRGGHQGP